MAKTLPQDQYHIELCTQFCADVEALITESNKKADDRVAKSGKPTNRLGYVDAVLIIAERRKIEPDLAAAFCSPDIKMKMTVEWESKHMIPKTGRLPF